MRTYVPIPGNPDVVKGITIERDERGCIRLTVNLAEVVFLSHVEMKRGPDDVEYRVGLDASPSCSPTLVIRKI